MSIASEIQDLQSNLQAAKSAVTTKGGTVADTGLAGLASEIASIPSGGSISSYGTVKYTENGVDKTVEMVTEEDYLELTIGVNNTMIEINNISINKDWIKEVTVGDGVEYLPDKFCYACNYITVVNLPNSVHYIGTNVFSTCLLLNSPLNLQNVRYIGSNFLYNCTAYNQPILLPKIDEIGDYFMFGCSSFNSAITLNDGLLMIGSRFMYGCSSFAQPFAIPSGLLDSNAFIYNPGERFMHNCNNFVGPLVCNTSTKIPSDTYTLGTTNASAAMYITGVTLTGPYAAQWKAALPDRTSSPYRKLIVGS